MHTHVQVAFQPTLLLHRLDGNELGAHTSARVPSVAPRLFVSKSFVAELSKLVPIRSGAPQLCEKDEVKKITHRKKNTQSNDRFTRMKIYLNSPPSAKE